MIESGYDSVYTTYSRSKAMKAMALMKDAGIGFVYKTSAETSSDDVLHEIRVREEDISLAQEVVIGMETRERE